jgi:hypothetical protein
VTSAGVETAAGSAPAGHGRGPVLRLVGLLAALAGFILVGQSGQGEVSHLALAGTTIFPFVLLAGLLQLARVYPATQPLAWAWFWLLLAGFGLLSLGLGSAALAVSAPPELIAGPVVVGLSLTVLTLLILAGLTVSGRWLAIGRRLGGRLEAGDPAHAQAVVGMLGAIIFAVLPLVLLHGQAPLLILLDQGKDVLGLDRSTTGQVLDLYYQLAWMVPLALVGAGVPLFRPLRASVERLGLRRPGRSDLTAAVLLAAGLWLLSTGLDLVIASLWSTLGWPLTDPEAVNRLMEVALSPAGAVAAALTAGLGEEILVRGLLQPRVGWLLANLAFTGIHAFQYGPDALLAVFVLGGALAAVRARWNTTVAIIVHGLYDLALFLAAAPG